MARPGAGLINKLITKGSAKSKAKSKPKRKVGRPPKARPQIVEGRSQRGRPRKSTIVIESDTESDNDDDKEYKPDGADVDDAASMVTDDSEPALSNTVDNNGEYTAAFPVVLTTYEMIIKDRHPLSQYDWGYIVVDEGHRLKNLDCKLMQEIKKYKSAGRMILTGTPLQVSLFSFAAKTIC